MKRISVIIPIYDVEAYLPKCIDSVLAQSHANLEVILVDDGSPDACPSICDRYAERDSRVKVIHKENGGISSARNAGLNAAAGDLISFVDADDWIDENMLESLAYNMRETESDIAICGMWTVFGGENIPGTQPEQDIYDHDDAMRLLLKDEITSYLWNKLYKKNLFGGVRFPESQLFEDVRALPHIFNQATRVSIVRENYYYYLQRKGSITATTRQSLNHTIQDYEAWRERFLYARARYPDLTPHLTGSLWFRIKRIYRTAGYLMETGEHVDLERVRAYFHDFKQLALYPDNKFCRENFRHISLNKFLMFSVAPKFYFSLIKLACKIKKPDGGK